MLKLVYSDHGKSLEDLINEVYDIVGSFSFERIDLHLDNEKKEDVIEKCQNDQFSSFGEFTVKKIEKTDGYKFFFNDDSWLMIRPSGTEPVLRTYSEAPSREIALKILESAQSGDQSVYNFGSKSNFTSAFLTPQAHELFTPKSNIDNKQNSFRGLEGYSYPEL